MPHPSHDVPGTLRRAPAPSFAHALCLDQGDHPNRWQINDAYGLMGASLANNDEVATWPVVYTPAPGEQWTAKTSHLPIHPAHLELDEQETTR